MATNNIPEAINTFACARATSDKEHNPMDNDTTVTNNETIGSDNKERTMNKPTSTINKDRRTMIEEKQATTKKNLEIPPSDEEVARRFSVIAQPLNMDMLVNLCYQVAGAGISRDDLLQDVIVDLATAPTLSDEARAVGLMNLPKGCSDRKLAATICRTRQQAHTTPMDDMEAGLRKAALDADGPYTKLDKDHAKTRINAMNQFALSMDKGYQPQRLSMDVLGRADMEFHKRAERIEEVTSNIDAAGDRFKGKGSIRLAKEQSLFRMLQHQMRVHGLHDLGRLDRVDRGMLMDWWLEFSTMVPDPETSSDIVNLMARRCDELGTHMGRQAAFQMLKDRGCVALPGDVIGKDRHGDDIVAKHGGFVPKDDEDAALVAVARGEVFSIGTLAAACSSSTYQASGKGKDDERGHMQLRVTIMLRIMGLDPTRTNRRVLVGSGMKHGVEVPGSKPGLLHTMAKEAGARCKVLTVEGRYNTLGRL
jgi:hypothetical protein